MGGGSAATNSMPSLLDPGVRSPLHRSRRTPPLPGAVNEDFLTATPRRAATQRITIFHLHQN